MRNWRASLGLAGLVAVLLALIVPVTGQAPPVRISTPVQGASSQSAQSAGLFRAMISVEGKAIPLPSGEWHVAGRAASVVGQGASQRPVLSVALVRLRGMAVDAAILIQTNRLDTASAWGKATACDRTDLYFARVRYASDHDGSCAYAAYVDAAVKRESTDPAWQQALLHGAGIGWRFPSHWVEAVYRITDPRDAIQVRYLFDPPATADGGPPRAAVRSLVAWTEASWYTVGSGFRNRLGAEDQLPDWRQAVSSEAATVLPPTGSEASQVEHLGTKTITYRLFGTITDMSVNYLWLGSLPSAGGLAAVGAVASSALYFVHELVWSRYEQPPVLDGDLPGIGVEGPGPTRS